jgi:threonine synthase
MPVSTIASLCPKCGSFLDIQYDYDKVADKITRRELQSRHATILAKWNEFLPIENKTMIENATLGETETPLVQCRKLAKWIGVQKLYVKNDSVFPTGSFKDRSMPMAIVRALELKVKTVAIASSGNAAASLAAHGARAGLETIAFVGADAPPSKLAQIVTYGAKVVLVKEEYSLVMEPIVAAMREFGWYDCDSEYNVFRFEGNKTCAYEIAEQFDWNSPDVVIVPMGSCSGITGQWKGLNELHRVGLIENLPRLVGIQPEACSQVVNAFKAKKDVIEAPAGTGKTVASALRVPNPPFAKRALQALYQSNGIGESVDEQELMEAVRMAASEGLFFEPAGAAPLAGAKKLVSNGDLDRDQTVVCVGTGHGLKMPEILMSDYVRPPAIEPTIEQIKQILELYHRPSKQYSNITA